MTVALIRVMALRQEQERTPRGPGVLFCRMAAQPLEALLANRLFGLNCALVSTLPVDGLLSKKSQDRIGF